MCMNIPENLFGEADFDPFKKSYGIGRTPWLVAPTAGAIVRFTHFELMPDEIAMAKDGRKS